MLFRSSERMARVEAAERQLRDASPPLVCNLSHVLSLKLDVQPRHAKMHAQCRRARASVRLSVVVARRHCDGTVASLRSVDATLDTVSDAVVCKLLCGAHCQQQQQQQHQQERSTRSRAHQKFSSSSPALAKRRLRSMLRLALDEEVLLRDETVDIAVRDVLKLDASIRQHLMSYAAEPLTFAQSVELSDAYDVGARFVDATTTTTTTSSSSSSSPLPHRSPSRRRPIVAARLPQRYMRASIESRRQLLAGVLDACADTRLDAEQRCYVLPLCAGLDEASAVAARDDVTFVARSLGLRVHRGNSVRAPLRLVGDLQIGRAHV